ncbi:NPC1-like intracellular cholesterol transporter 1 isoform X1 [Biomphalaria glabrata]|uniref:NPC1-like intracellular cholesterol transporter 1 isoform X1 n=1 Tax=Biomphalaria glabrata TaxID=6526 RepID=A0A9W3AD10_BIOGL|nr:NPC1-like intracellular cholesterol transporter 1 isoform X1 [Biomphalaria glabrata]XP_013072271.2 NPC1-like intracellular cholesterol transporter 1 isoform X1 [Biomphalaria glabrata]XP_013072272.2 NPC1-like intracellular cholesterol transporter 1 isoform X1 [Biomphalaria glabrata]XP_055885174.1 NPC1-like intracellular cholesterol transporter 1 isoform X1 [Biomphalaria glabrata]XP_055885175.1 NPC1-like intracellular cholesterol transporter 1 isoform X1 [Biomphalaria glabrata]XP_055885176.1 
MSNSLSTNTKTTNMGNKSTEEMTPEKNKRMCNACMNKISSFIIWSLETVFFKVGLFIGTYPLLTIITCSLMCGLCGIGMKTFHESQEQEKLWVPQSSRLINEKIWVDKIFPQDTRFVSFLTVQPEGNILTPEFLNALMDYYLQSFKFSFRNQSFSDLCLRVNSKCYVSSLLEIWNYDADVIRNLTETDIKLKLWSTPVSPVTGTNVQTLLGGKIKMDSNGNVVFAEATEIMWIMEKQEDTSTALDFEKAMIDMALKGIRGINKTYVYATRSFDDEGYGVINQDIKLLAMGFIIVFAFVLLSLGKFDLLRQKVYVSLVGMYCIGLAILVSYGLSTALDVIYNPILSMLPFLLLGVGVDDMFVIMETWKNLSPEEQKLDIPHKLGVTLSHAGVSVTVTSVTDIIAFGIGASTAIPALSSFCIYASIGILALFLLVATVFASSLALDERRLQSGRDACLCCYKHKQPYTFNKCSSDKSFLQIVFANYYGPFLLKLPVKVLVIIFTLAMAGLGIWRAIHLRQDFDLTNYLPSDSYAYAYDHIKKEYFDRQGMETRVYCGGLNYFRMQDVLQNMLERISNSSYIQTGSVNSWFTAFQMYLPLSGTDVTSEEVFNAQLFQFMHSLYGQRFAPFVQFNSSSLPVSVKASYFTMTHSLQIDSQHDVIAMDKLREIIDTAGLPQFHGAHLPKYMCFAYSREYMTCETNKVLLSELYRNLGLSAACVFAVTVILIANLWTSLLVFVCVLFTMVDVCGILEVWGIKIDTASSILLTLSVGLAVDYSAHIGHTFMTIGSNRNNRALMSLKAIGPAVFNGGLSTFLAFVLLANSASFGFQMFFKVFSAVVIFGLYHGLVFLPVILSLVGSSPYLQAKDVPTDRTMDCDEEATNTILVNDHAAVTKNNIELIHADFSNSRM